MSSRNLTPEVNARRAKIRELLQEANITGMADIQKLFKETIAEFMENGLEVELDEELGYSKYDYRNKETENSRNGHSSKKLKTSIIQDIEEKILSMYAKGMTTSDILLLMKGVAPCWYVGCGNFNYNRSSHILPFCFLIVQDVLQPYSWRHVGLQKTS